MYGIIYQGKQQYLSNKKGWGPTFTSFPEDAKQFATPDEAQAYIDEYLDDFDVNVCSLPLGDDELDESYEFTESEIKHLVTECVKRIAREKKARL